MEPAKVVPPIRMPKQDGWFAIHCPGCRRMLMEGRFEGEVRVKCRRCGMVAHLSTPKKKISTSGMDSRA